jgi:hypothetical protein
MAWTLKLKVLFLVALVSMGACSPERPADPSKTQPTTADAAKASVSGAWSPIDAFSPDVQEAARFAVQSYAVQNRARVLFKDVTQVRLQSVAGLKSEMQLLVSLEGVSRNARATVWR